MSTGRFKLTQQPDNCTSQTINLELIIGQDNIGLVNKVQDSIKDLLKSIEQYSMQPNKQPEIEGYSTSETMQDMTRRKVKGN